MACSRNFSLSAKEDDTPLESAIYSGAQNKIFGVRGKWLYKFNAETGKKEAEIRFTTSALSPSSICEVGTSLYIGVRQSAKDLLDQTPFTNAVMRPERDIFKINAATMAVVGVLGLGDSVLGQFPPFDNQSYAYGWTSLFTVGTKIVGLGGSLGMFLVDPTNLPGGISLSTFPSQADAICDIDYDPVQGAFWTNDARSRDIWVTDSAFSLTAHTTPDTIATSPPYRGLTFCPAGTGHALPKVYAVDGTSRVIKIDANVAYSTLPGFFTDPTWSSLFILEAAAKPVKIKYNAQDDKIYIPTWDHDTVEVLDPATDTITAIKTGFTDVFDCVFTPTKKFGVQNSSVALREIV